MRNSTLCSTRGTGDRLRLVARDTRANVLHPPCTLPSKVGCPHVQKRGPSPPAERPETVLDVRSGPERRRHSCAQAESAIGICVPPRANWSLTYPHRPHRPTRPPLRCPLHSAFARLRRAHSDRLKYPQVPSSRPIPVAGSRLLCAPGRPSRGLGHLQARLRAIPLRRRLESP